LATGIPKTQRKDKEILSLPETPIDVSLSYEGKRSEQEILKTEPASICTLWKGILEQDEQFFKKTWQMIKHFDLCAPETLADDLTDALAQWLEWQKLNLMAIK
jgi:hypothetical protein